MSTSQSVWAVWNYSLFFMTLSTIAVFTIDMLGHKTKSISSNLFSLTVVLGIVAGELVITYLPLTNFNSALGIGSLLCLAVSIILPLKYRTTDPVTHRNRPFKRIIE